VPLGYRPVVGCGSTALLPPISPQKGRDPNHSDSASSRPTQTSKIPPRITHRGRMNMSRLSTIHTGGRECFRDVGAGRKR